jgi:hypothetical protein
MGRLTDVDAFYLLPFTPREENTKEIGKELVKKRVGGIL